MTSLSLIVLSCEEELNLPYCLESVRGLAEDIYVVDSGSADATQKCATEFGATVVEHAFENQAQQFNWALQNLSIESDWVLRLDADEYLLPELREEMAVLLPTLPMAVTGLYMKRRLIFQGRWIRHGGCYPIWLLRVFRRGKARSELLEMDEHLVVTEGETRCLQHDFVDHNRKGLSFWTRKHEGYADREARILYKYKYGDVQAFGAPGRLAGDFRERRRWRKLHLYLRFPCLLRAFLYFFYRYVVRLGFLDGMVGLEFHVLQGFWYRFYVDARLREMERGPSKHRGF